MIPQANLKASYLARQQEIESAISRVLDSGWYVLGEEVQAFEQEFGAFCGVEQAIGVANGTDALTIALKALGIKPGDGVITVSLTALPTLAGCSLAGAELYLADVTDEGLMCPESVEQRLIAAKGRIKAIVPVHLYGKMVAMGPIMDLAEKYGCFVVEDCAQAHAATEGGRMAGSIGHAGAFSFYPTKNLGAIGDGGAVTVSDKELGEKIVRLRQYGWENRISVEPGGMNSRLDEIQAAILRVKLQYLHEETQMRRQIARQYQAALAPLKGISAIQEYSDDHAYHQFVCRSNERDELQAGLRDGGVATAVHYPMPCHKEPAWCDRVHLPQAGLPVTERLCTEIFSLPMYPELSQDQLSSIITVLADVGGGA